jgi:hypothetical protein
MLTRCATSPVPVRGMRPTEVCGLCEIQKRIFGLRKMQKENAIFGYWFFFLCADLS